MESEGPYTTGLSEGLVFKDNRVVENFDSERDKLNACRLANAAHAEGRKAAESYTEKMLKFATDEVRKCHTEIRRLEDKYARNFYRMPIPLDEELAKKARGIE